MRVPLCFHGPNTAAHRARKLYFGTATNNDELSDAAYFSILNDITMFGQLTPAKAMKWVSMNPPPLEVFVTHTFLCVELNGT